MRSSDAFRARPLRLFNTLGRRIEDFAPRSGNEVGIYSCGPTVYLYAHIGNLRAYVFSDVLRRTLLWKGYGVKQVVNITDVGHLTSDLDEGDDKLEVTARREGRSIWDIAAYYTKAFEEDVAKLRILPPDVAPRATDHIPEMIEFARTLEEKGYTYEIEAGLFFDTSRVPDYGKLGLLNLEGQQEGARVAPTPGKRHPADFAIWRASPPDAQRLMEWDSPWGKGAPGWHLECSVMSMKYLGGHFDIHTGGVDHIPVHHTNEIAQSEAYLGDGEDWVNHWMHNEFVVFKEGKMSKSTGQFVRLVDLEAEGFHPSVYRYFLLGAHYRKQVDFAWRSLESARTALGRILERLSGAPRDGDENHPPRPVEAVLQERAQPPSGAFSRHLAAFDEALSADLNTPQAVAALVAATKDPALDDAELRDLVGLIDGVLGVGLLTLAPEDLDLASGGAIGDEDVETLVKERNDARSRGDFAAADRIRDQLADLGVEIRDTPEGTTWRWRSS